ncbi:MAG: TetR/AcrR family transcriptional regulator [Myxococcales bacterium]|nr:TetR/AcrR family transcriptional regulator [Myxococcales bacterium]
MTGGPVKPRRSIEALRLKRNAKLRPTSNAKLRPPAAPTSARRLPKAERREQLLDTAHDILQAEGPQALTLGYLAERAGVTKPITYEHFKTRPGLLIALARQIDDRQIEVLRDAVTHAPPRLDRVARVLGTTYMHCYTTVGPQWQAISAALRSESEMDAVQQEMLDRYVLIYRDALAPFSRLGSSELHLRCVAIIGAAEALARAMLVGRIDEAAAAAALGSLIVAWLTR